MNGSITHAPLEPCARNHQASGRPRSLVCVTGVGVLLCGLLGACQRGGSASDPGEPAAAGGAPNGPEERVGLVVTTDEARGCDLVLDVGEMPLAAVTFGETTLGAYVQRPPRLAISMVTQADEGFSKEAVWLEGDLEHVRLSSATCYDRLGQPLAEGSVELP